MSPIDFQELVRKEKEGLNELCTVWESHLAVSDRQQNVQNGPPSSHTRASVSSGSTVPEAPILDDELAGLVRATTGQARMLLSQRFQQFESLILDALLERSEKPIGDEDLQGFWDMIYFQIEDCQKQFKILQDAKENNWTLVESSKENKKTSVPQKHVTKNIQRKSRSRPKSQQSNIRDFIAKKRQETLKMKEMNASFSALNVEAEN